MTLNKIILLLFFASANCYTAIDVKSAKHFKQILKKERVVVANFHAENWCRYSQSYIKPFKEIETKYSKKATFVKINKDILLILLIKYNVSSVPTTIIFNHKRELFRTNATDKNYIENKLIESLKIIK